MLNGRVPKATDNIIEWACVDGPSHGNPEHFFGLPIAAALPKNCSGFCISEELFRVLYFGVLYFAGWVRGDVRRSGLRYAASGSPERLQMTRQLP